jgi:hypothetical protein
MQSLTFLTKDNALEVYDIDGIRIVRYSKKKKGMVTHTTKVIALNQPTRIYQRARRIK